ncbi:MAG TPA: polyprenol phosphomannose-dependent alpha 1,6 mannosyltransferase MptB [Propionicimonas sp.]|nr:polyprenol phosphomannose-dependent alpha 1,6 mannosyltransferase MptB [Propionicimonas sp.]HRA07550.1 polyprenol phosphomannose-dependent alpha 1,6 mannosyltransferase MptB [Propionicimonas sp.]
MTNLSATTLRSRGVWVGVLGSLAVAWGSCHPEFSPSAYGWPSDVVNAIGEAAPIPANRVLIVVGTILLTWAWWHVRPTREREPVHAGLTMLLWSLPLLLVPPVLSPDAVLYADLGWTLHSGHSPYEVGLATSGGPFAAWVDPLWAGSGVAYPPLSLRLNQVVVTASGMHPYWSVIAMRVPVLLSVATMGWLVPRIASLLGRPVRGAVWLAVLNPLLLLHFIGAGHNDAPMVALSLAAIWVVCRWPHWWASFLAGPVVVALAMAFKQQGGLTVVAVAGLPVAASLASATSLRRLWLLAWRTALATAVTLVAFVGISLVSGLGFGWLEWLDLMGLAGTPAPLALLSKGGALVWQAAGGSYTGFLIVAGRIGTLILLAVLAWICVRFANRPLEVVAWGSLAIAVLGQALHPWYLPWSLALLGLVPLNRRRRYWVFGFAIAFCIWNALQTVIWHGQT